MPIAPKKVVTIKDIALRVGLSDRAVSQALNGRAESSVQVSEKTRRRIQAVAAKMGYSINRAARALRTGSTGLVGILNFQSLQHQAAVRLHGALQEMRRAGLPPLVYNCEADRAAIEDTTRAIAAASVDGVLLLSPPPSFTQADLETLKANHNTVVAVGARHLHGISSYVPDLAGGFRQLVEHLIGEGRRSLCLLTLKSKASLPNHSEVLEAFRLASHSESAQRLGVKSAIFDLPLPTSAAVMAESSSSGIHPLHASGYLGMREALASGIGFDAVLCRSDSAALGALLACRRAGIAVPEQMAITGFDDEPASSAGWTPLTTVGFPDEQIIRPAVEELHGLIEKKLKPGEKLVQLPGRLVVRESSQRPG